MSLDLLLEDVCFSASFMSKVSANWQNSALKFSPKALISVRGSLTNLQFSIERIDRIPPQKLGILCHQSKVDL